MSYCTVQQVREALAPGVWDDVTAPPTTQTAADLPDAQLSEAITEASSYIDTAIGGRYIVPVAPIDTSTPHPIDFWAINIAAYLATCTYRGSADFTDNDPIYRRFLMSSNQIDDIKKGIGTLSIPSSLGTPSSASGSDGPINTYSGNLFETSDFDVEFPRESYLDNRRFRGEDRGWW